MNLITITAIYCKALNLFLNLDTPLQNLVYGKKLNDSMNSISFNMYFVTNEVQIFIESLFIFLYHITINRNAKYQIVRSTNRVEYHFDHKTCSLHNKNNDLFTISIVN